MKNIPTICALALCSASISHAALVASYEFTGGSISSSAITPFGTAGDVTFPVTQVSDGGDPPTFTPTQFTAVNDAAQATDIPSNVFFTALEFTFTVSGLAVGETFQIDSFGAEGTYNPGGTGRRFVFLISEDGGANYRTLGNQGARRYVGVHLEETLPGTLSNSYSNGQVLHMQINVRDSNAGGDGGYGMDNVNLSGSVIPEPSSVALLGLSGVGLLLRRRRA